MSTCILTRSLPLIAALVTAATTITTTWAAFTNATPGTGISHIHSLRGDGVNNHAGAAAADVDGDGYTDLLFAKFGSPPLLYMNQGNGQFVNEAVARGLSGASDAAGFGAGDFDNDGDKDLFIVPHSGNRFFLFINDGTGNFVEEAVSRGASVPVTLQPHKGYSVGLVDYNLDGYLDVYVSEWGIAVDAESSSHSVLLKNVGASNPGHFVQATVAAGLQQPVRSDLQHGFASGWADFDEDGWPDLALVSDYGKSQMYWNNGNGTFTQTTSVSGVGFDENGMGIAVADYNADGLMDFYVTSIYDEFSFNKNGTHTGNKLYRNNGDRNFQETAFDAGVSRTGWGWGTAFLDYENDGDFDLVATNGMNIAEGGNIDQTPYVAAASDVTKLFINDGTGSFTNAVSSGINDSKYGKAVVVLDYDNDGDQDFVIANSFSDPIVYRNDASTNGNDWIRFSFEGTVSNRDGIGTKVVVSENGKSQYLVFNPSNSYIGQHEAYLHFGFGDSDGVIDLVSIRWPTGFVQELENLSANRLHAIVEPDDAPTPPIFSTQPSFEGELSFGSELDLRVEAIGSPPPVFVWEKNGVAIQGQTTNRLLIKRLAPFDEGTYRVRAISSGGEVLSNEVTIDLSIDLSAHSIARWWNEFMMEAIRRDFPDPTKHSRNLYQTSAAMWDAFWPYEEEQWTTTLPAFHREDLTESDWGADRIAAQSEAISHAAYTILSHRYKNSPGAARSLFGFQWLMDQFGYDFTNTSVSGNSPAAVGNRIGNSIITTAYEDGSNELGSYADTSGYVAVNGPMPVELTGTNVVDVNRWQPLAFDFAVSQNGIPIGALVQKFLGVNWREVGTFALKKTSANTIAFDPGPPPQFEGETKAEFVDSAVQIIRFSSYLDPNDGEMINISPGARLNNPIGTNDGTGRPINPYTGEAYPDNMVKRGDYGRILAEFWADGPASETPPGHWNTLHNEITEDPLFERRYMGVGPELSPLEWDIRAYLTLNGGMHDAAMAAWTLKRQYDYSRPITMIRYLGQNGQSTDPNLPSYSPDGLPLIPGLIELVTAESAAVGERHHHLVDDFFDIGKVAIKAWSGQPNNSESEVGGVDWIWPGDWVPYQRSTFVSPAFAAYVSGHSTFSRTGAEIMTLLTGSPFFPGGMGEFEFHQGEFLEFENGPSENVTLQWATYYDAADQAGISRLYGGIHVRADDFVGRILGARIGAEAFVKAHRMRNGGDRVGHLDSLMIGQVLRAGDDSPMVRFDMAGELENLPIKLISAAAVSQLGESSSLFVVVPSEIENGGGSKVSFLNRTGLAEGVEFAGFLEENGVISVEIIHESNEPVILLATAFGSSLANSTVDSELTLWRKSGANWEQLDYNDDWLDADLASLSEALILREDGAILPHSDESSLALVLASGEYRLELKAKTGSGMGMLKIRAQK